MLRRQTQTESYWQNAFRVTDADMEYLYNLLLEEETPLSGREIALRLVDYRMRREEEDLRRKMSRGTLFQPKDAYEIGESLVFPAFGFALGKVVGKRPGINPEHGDFVVIEVEFEDGRRREFASQLKTPHVLNRNGDAGDNWVDETIFTPETVLERFGEKIVKAVEERLRAEEDIVSIGGRWFPRSLLAEINIGHLNLAEAALDVAGGGPLSTEDLLKTIELPQEVNRRLQAFSLEYALQEDKRFDEVGPAGQILWYLRRMEPEAVQNPPERLLYKPIEYDRSVLTPDFLVLEEDLDDEFSPLPEPEGEIRSATITLIFPHWREGTLPLSSRLRKIFPTAYQAPRVRFTLVDGQTGEEFPGWVVRKERFVYGLAEYYRKYRIPVGANLSVRIMDPKRGKIMIEHGGRRRTEWLRMVIPRGNTISFELQRRSIGAEYDEQMVLVAEDLDGIDEVWEQVQREKRDLRALLRELMADLAKLSPQSTVHSKTLYSAVNVIRRCPPGPIFATLLSGHEFEHVGDYYWRLDISKV